MSAIGSSRLVTRFTRRWSAVVPLALVVGLTASVVGPLESAAASGSDGTSVFTATINVPAPPSSNFSGASAGGDGWSVEVTDTQLFNVFHHNTVIGLNCHEQSNAATCPGYPATVTDGSGNNFATGGQPGLYYDPSAGFLYLFATRTSDDTPGVVCMNVSSTTSGPVFCGFTALAPSGQAQLVPYGMISDPVEVDSNWYAFNYVDGAPGGDDDELLCFSLTTFSACPNQPFNVNFGVSQSNVTDSAPAPSIAAFGNEIEIPTNPNGGSTYLACFNPTAAGDSCGGSWPIATGVAYAGTNGGAFPLLDSQAHLLGFCLPTGSDPCYNLDGSSAATPGGLGSVVTGTTVWNGPGLNVGPRVYAANQNTDTVQCYSYSTDSSCPNFPRGFTNLGNIYTTNPDPQRPTCIWVNANDGSEQIQNFDAFTAGACGQGPIRLLATSFVAPPSQCTPSQWESLQITNPTPASAYGGGTVEFENNDGGVLNTSPQANPATLDSTGTVNLSAYNFASASQLPDFVITLNSPPPNLSAVTVTVSWEGSSSNTCSQPGTQVSGAVNLTAPAGAAAVGSNQTISASVETNNTPVANGTVNLSCVSGPCTTPTATVTTNDQGIATFSYESGDAGTDVWQGSYTPASGGNLTSNDAAVVWNFLASASPAVTTYGNTIGLTETGLLAGATGPVTFSSGGITLCTATLPSTSCSTGVLAPGSYPVTASYPGDANDAPASASTSFAVNPASSTTGLEVFDSSTSAQWSGSELPGAEAYAVSTVSHSASGSVTYDFYSGDNCSGTPVTSTASVSEGSGDASATSSALAGGTYSFQATYGGSTDYSASISPCVPFSVGRTSATVSSAVDDAGSGTAWGGSEVTGASAFGTSSLSGAAGYTPSGSANYALYSDDNCTGGVLQQSSVTLAAGEVPPSVDSPPLAAGSYSYQLTYLGDSNYGAQVGPCRSFAVGQATPSVSNPVEDAATGSAWSVADVTGARSEDGSSVAGVGSFAPSGSVEYSLYKGDSCDGDAIQTSGGNVAGGIGSLSTPSSPLAAGTYSYRATYAGDSNYTSAGSPCTNFLVGQANPSVTNPVLDAASSSPWSNTEVIGSESEDSTSVAGAPGIAPSGSVTYTLYSGASCAQDSVLQTSSESVAGGSGATSSASDPLAAGTYSYSAGYSGDDNYTGAASACTSFSVQKTALQVGQLVYDASDTSLWTGVEATGAASYDASSLAGVEGFAPTGSVEYDLYSGPLCQGSALQTSSADVSGGTPSASSSSDPLDAGSYSYRTTYSGDDNYLEGTSSCQPFSVARSERAIGAVVYDAASTQPWAGTEVTGGSAYDTAAVTAVQPVTPDVRQAHVVEGAIVPTGSVTYSFFDNNMCSGTPITTDTESLDGGNVPDSAPTSALPAGNYSFEAGYSGDSNFQAATGSCTPFSVLPSPTTAGADVLDAASQTAWNGTEVTGASAYGTSAVAPVPAPETVTIEPGGSVTYSLFDNRGCSLPAAWTDKQSLLATGAVPPSLPTAALPAGAYSLEVSYGGDHNYLASTSACAPFLVSKSPATLTANVYDGATRSLWSGTEDQGASAYDVSALSGVTGFVPTGTVTYRLFDNTTCAGGAASTERVSLTAGKIPPSVSSGELGPGGYSYRATYGGDALYLPATGNCEPFVTHLVGYRTEGGDGGVFDFGATFFGAVGFPSPPGLGLHLFNFVGIATKPNGYWLVEKNGGVFAFGAAKFRGSLPKRGISVNDIVGIAATSDGKGYWIASATGGIYSFGDAVSHGSLPAKHVKVDDIVAISSLDSGGYLLLGSNGAVYAFGDAKYNGSCVAAHAKCAGATNVVGLASPERNGYWLVTSNGHVYGFGDLASHGDCFAKTTSCAKVSDVVGIATPDTGGYWLAGANGAIYPFGDAQALGNEVGAPLARPIVAISG